MRWIVSHNGKAPAFGVSRVLHEFQTDFAANDGGGFSERAERNSIVFGVEKTVKSGAAGAHAPGHLGFGEALLVHRGLHLAGNDTLDGRGADLFVEALIAQPTIEGRADVFASFIPLLLSFS